jgi:hypothetical protein
MRTGFAVLALLVLGLGFGAAACGGDDGSGPPAANNPGSGSIAPVPSGSRQRAIAFVEHVDVAAPPGGPVTVRVVGQLPTPCHELKWSVGTPDPSRHIAIDVFSEVEADALCSQVTKPFDQVIDVGTVGGGDYQAMVNGTAYPFTAG